MIDLVKRFFGKTDEGDPPGPHDVNIATCALLLEMAHIDGEFSPQERERMIAILQDDFHVPPDEIEALVMASQQEVATSIDLWGFTRLIKERYSLEEKIRVIEAVWEIVYADGLLDAYEDYLVHKLAHLLGLRHAEMIDAKLRVKPANRR